MCLILTEQYTFLQKQSQRTFPTQYLQHKWDITKCMWTSPQRISHILSQGTW